MHQPFGKVPDVVGEIPLVAIRDLPGNRNQGFPLGCIYAIGKRLPDAPVAYTR